MASDTLAMWWCSPASEACQFLTVVDEYSWGGAGASNTMLRHNVCVLVRKVAPGGVLATAPSTDVLAEPERECDVT